MAKRLWEKGETIDQTIHQFTVGDDPAIDRELVRWDAIASAAHARMLHSIGILDKAETNKLLIGLQEVVELSDDGQFEIPEELEDCHSAIEAFLSEKVGPAGLKIHTGRSRNDQVLIAIRLCLRDSVLALLGELAELVQELFTRAEASQKITMPGYTHMQPAMPSSVSIWLHAYAEGALELMRDGLMILERLDTNPLGVASGFWVPLDLNREMTSKLLGITRPQRNSIHVQNSRGIDAMKVVRFCVDISSLVEKFSWDLLLYGTREFGFFKLPRSFTSGSSIMPQKHNPDVLELLRARASLVRAAEFELGGVLSKLPSSYHRDFQCAKEPMIRAIADVAEMLPIVREVVKAFEINEEGLAKAMGEELYATYAVYREVKKGKTFREAYVEVAKQTDAGKIDKKDLACDFELIQKVHLREVNEARRELETLSVRTSDWVKRAEQAEDEIFMPVTI